MDTEKMAEAQTLLERAVASILEAVPPFVDAVVRWVEETAAILSERMATITGAWLEKSQDWEFVRAYIWACGSRPHWVRRLNKTKKARTRKKYQDRILRAYREKEGKTWHQ